MVLTVKSNETGGSPEDFTEKQHLKGVPLSVETGHGKQVLTHTPCRFPSLKKRFLFIGENIQSCIGNVCCWLQIAIGGNVEK